MADEYIKRSDALDAVFHQYCASSDETEEALGNAIEEIRAIQTADVQEVRHGMWMPIIEGNEYGESYQVGCFCSECGVELGYESPFCPDCGADMRGNK